jgi:hypothetical protein
MQKITIRDPFGKGDITVEFTPYKSGKVITGIKDNHWVRDETYEENLKEELKRLKQIN